MSIKAYSYEADIHCIACTQTRFETPAPCDKDENGVPIMAQDNEGNPIHPVFSWSEIGVNPDCGTCGENIQ